MKPSNIGQEPYPCCGLPLNEARVIVGAYRDVEWRLAPQDLLRRIYERLYDRCHEEEPLPDTVCGLANVYHWAHDRAWAAKT